MVEVLYEPLLICSGFCAFMQPSRITKRESGGEPDTTKSIIRFLRDGEAVFQHIMNRARSKKIRLTISIQSPAWIICLYYITEGAPFNKWLHILKALRDCLSRLCSLPTVTLTLPSGTPSIIHKGEALTAVHCGCLPIPPPPTHISRLAGKLYFSITATNPPLSFSLPIPPLA